MQKIDSEVILKINEKTDSEEVILKINEKTDSEKEPSERESSGPEGIWTPGLRIKSPSLCLTKLRAHALFPAEWANL